MNPQRFRDFLTVTNKQLFWEINLVTLLQSMRLFDC